jgi:hypothetical protein
MKEIISGLKMYLMRSQTHWHRLSGRIYAKRVGAAAEHAMRTALRPHGA